MLVSACVLPHPPVVVPEVAVRSPGWLTHLRTLCLDSVRSLVGVEPDVVAVVGSAKAPGRWGVEAGGTMAGYGVDVGAGGAARDQLPLSLTVGAWLLDAVGWGGDRLYVAVDGSLSADDAARLGRELTAERRTALLVLGDGSAKRSKQAPGYLDERAGAFDREVVAAIRRRDGAALGRLESGLADQLWVAGLPTWQVLAGTLDDVQDAAIRYDDAPTGVGYFVIDLALR